MDITATAYKILKYLKRNQPPFIVDTTITRNLIFHRTDGGTMEEFNAELQSLVDKGLINETKSDVSITPAGIDYLVKIEHQNEELAYEDVFDDYDYSVLKFLYVNNWGVRIDEFPEIIMKKASERFSGINEGPLMSFLYSLNKYIDEYNNEYSNSYKLNYHGIQYYKFLTEKKKAEKEAKSESPRTVYQIEKVEQHGTNMVGNSNTNTTTNTNSNNTIIEHKSPHKKWYTVARDEVIKIAVASIIAYGAGIFTGKSCNQNPPQNQVQNSIDSVNNTR